MTYTVTLELVSAPLGGPKFLETGISTRYGGVGRLSHHTMTYAVTFELVSAPLGGPKSLETDISTRYGLWAVFRG